MAFWVQYQHGKSDSASVYTNVLDRVAFGYDDMALHLCSYTRDVVLERSCLFLSVGVCFWGRSSGVQTRCVEHSEVFSFLSLATEIA
jgi:hypothetical protein